MTVLDEVIENACKKVGITWYPFFLIEGKTIMPADIETPAILQEVDDSWRLLDNGSIVRTCHFYIFDKAPKEINQTSIKEEIMVKQERLTMLIIQLYAELNRSQFKFRLQDGPQKAHLDMPIWNVGQDFTIQIEYVPCQI